MARHAFVTGATGFVGGHLVRELLEQGWRVTALVRDPSAAIGSDVEWCGGDITDAASVSAAMPRAADCVFHVAASTSVWSRRNREQARVNIEGTRHVVAAAVAAGARRLVHTSSFSVWGFVDGLLDEQRPWRERDGWINYVRTKREAERIVKQAVSEHGLDASILNPAHILGPGDSRNWARMIRLVDAGKLPGVPPGGGAFSDVREVARAHLRAAGRPGDGSNYLLGGEETTFMDLVGQTGALLGKPVPRRPTPAWLMRVGARAAVMKSALTGREPVLTPEAVAMLTHHVHVDSGRARRDLGYATTPVHTLLSDTCAWLRQEGLIA